ncbi:hypothetical protein BK809_0001151 [Diplodia seriata]|uniref:Tyrosinase copper-binding domain-containing protein n=1 Tax=Diplodia seriata TaxID=420778 RepID=A0A1S8B5X6_9PEZI|nr:hypothetical protein BK809_0001151 [Diplodia seriata]
MFTSSDTFNHWTLDATEEEFPKAPIFDAVTGFGGNGYYIDSSNDTSVRLRIPGKTGGGCVTDGPFRNYTVNMGPNSAYRSGLTKVDSTAYNPRCLTRDFSPWLASQKLNMTMVDKALAGKTFQEFDIAVQGRVEVDGLTYHGGGHLGVGGELGAIGDLYSSPSDVSSRVESRPCRMLTRSQPLFFFHHANMDRIWKTWQSQGIRHSASQCSRADKP